MLSLYELVLAVQLGMVEFYLCAFILFAEFGERKTSDPAPAVR